MFVVQVIGPAGLSGSWVDDSTYATRNNALDRAIEIWCVMGNNSVRIINREDSSDSLDTSPVSIRANLSPDEVAIARAARREGERNRNIDELGPADWNRRVVRDREAAVARARGQLEEISSEIATKAMRELLPAGKEEKEEEKGSPAHPTDRWDEI